MCDLLWSDPEGSYLLVVLTFHLVWLVYHYLELFKIFFGVDGFWHIHVTYFSGRSNRKL